MPGTTIRRTAPHGATALSCTAGPVEATTPSASAWPVVIGVAPHCPPDHAPQPVMSRRHLSEVAIAVALARAGCHREAAWTLASVLDAYSPITAGPDEALADAATAYLNAAHAEPGRYPALLQWAHGAYVTYRAVLAAGDGRTLRAGVRYAGMLRDHWLPSDAVRVGRQLVAAHTPRTGAMGSDAVTAWRVLAVSLHAAGQCDEARAVISEAWCTRRTGPRGDTAESTVSLLVAMCTMAAQCGAAQVPDWVTLLFLRFPPPSRYTEMVAALREPTAACEQVAVWHRRRCGYRPRVKAVAAPTGIRASGTSPRTVRAGTAFPHRLEPWLGDDRRVW